MRLGYQDYSKLATKIGAEVVTFYIIVLGIRVEMLGEERDPLVYLKNPWSPLWR